MRWIAWLFTICTMTSCTFDTSWAPTDPDGDGDHVTATPDAQPATPDAPPPDACTGKECNEGPGKDH